MAENDDAFALVQQFLADWGLQDEAGWAWSEIKAGSSPARISLDLTQRPSYRKAYGGIQDVLKAAGQPLLTPAQIRATNQAYAQQLRNIGEDPSRYNTPEDFYSLYANGIDPGELGQRLQVESTYRASSPHLKAAFSQYVGMDLSDQDVRELIRGQRSDLVLAYTQATGTPAPSIIAPTGPTDGAFKGPAPSPVYPEGTADPRAALERKNAALEHQISDWGAGRSTKSDASIQILINRQTRVQQQIAALDSGKVVGTPGQARPEPSTTSTGPLARESLATSLSSILGRPVSLDELQRAMARAQSEEEALYRSGGTFAGGPSLAARTR